MIEDPTKIKSFEKAWEASIEQDHHAIQEILERLEAATDPGVLVPLFEELRAALAEHFEREEEPDGLHEIVASMAPNTVASLQNVLGEHQDFLTRSRGRSRKQAIPRKRPQCPHRICERAP